MLKAAIVAELGRRAGGSTWDANALRRRTLACLMQAMKSCARAVRHFGTTDLQYEDGRNLIRRPP